jgi:hypothetical protein
MTNSSPNSTYPRQAADPESTLRLLAQLSPPDGLSDRVHRRLANAPEPAPARRFWSLWLPAHRLQFAGAAVLVTALAASSWTILERRHPQLPAAQNPAPRPAAAPDSSAFSTAGSERRPSTLKAIKVPPTPKTSSSQKAAPAGKKPSAAKSRAARPSSTPVD